jgi:hypothetical protein
MSLPLKIAAGVFVGIVAVLVLLKIPSRMASSREDHYRHLLWKIKPNDVLARCGQPLKDRTVNLCPKCDHPPMLRTLTYKSNAAGNVVLEFSVSKEDQWFWSYMSMTDELSGHKYDKYTSQALELPCLVAGR